MSISLNNVIHKQPFDITDIIELSMPEGAKITGIAMQNEIPCVWYECNIDNDLETVRLRAVGTGHALAMTTAKHSEFITTLFYSHQLVFHMYRVYL